MSEPIEVEFSPLTIHIADDQAWYYHALVVTLLRQSDVPRVRVLTDEGIAIDSAIGHVTTTRNDDGTTDITIVPDMGTEETWHLIASQVRRFAAEVTNRRKQMTGMTADEVIERYYRSRAAGSKVTLKQLAAQAGISYDYLRERKVRYDREGRWGSKAHKSTHTESEI